MTGRGKWGYARGGRVLGYLGSVALVALATLLTRKTQPIVGEISPFYFAAVMLSTWFGGVGPGLVATAAAGWASAYYFYDIPAGTGMFGLDDMLRLAVFLMISLLVSFLMHLRMRAEEAVRVANEQLEGRVLDRTRELELSNHLLRESEEGFRALVEGVTDCAIFMLDGGGRVISWNMGAERVQGYVAAEAAGESFSRFYTSEDRERGRPEEHLARARESGRAECEGWRVRRDGSRFWASVVITALRDEGGSLRGFAHVARDITKIMRLEKEVLEISEGEQRRIGHDLHDGLGQELTGLAFLSQILQRKLVERSLPESADAARITALINQAIEQTRELARGLAPVEWGPDGLVAGLRNLSSRFEATYGVPCEFRCDKSVRVASHAAAMHLYRIAQEALNNAARHAEATRVWVGLAVERGGVALTIEDNGKGFPSGAPAGAPAPGRGFGMHLMPYRARMLGASFGVGARAGGGTVVRCVYSERSSPLGEGQLAEVAAART